MLKEITLWGKKFDIKKTQEIELSNINGFIPREIGLLENLIFLDLSRNNLEGKIPAELFKLKK